MRATVLCLHQRSSLHRHTLPSTTEGLILLKLTWNKHLWDLSGASDETHTHRFMQVRHPSRHDSKKSMTPSTLKKAQQTHKQTQTKLFSIFSFCHRWIFCTGGKRKPRHLQFINATCLWSLPSCVLSDQGDAIRVWTCLLSGFYNSAHLRAPARILRFQKGTAKAKCLRRPGGKFSFHMCSERLWRFSRTAVTFKRLYWFREVDLH